MTDETVTSDLEDFGNREIEEQREILKAFYNEWYSQMFNDYFHQEKVQVMFNKMSGYVFLTNENCDAAMNVGTDEPTLEMHLSCPECGYEGTETEIIEDSDRCEHIIEAFNMEKYYSEELNEESN